MALRLLSSWPGAEDGVLPRLGGLDVITRILSGERKMPEASRQREERKLTKTPPSTLASEKEEGSRNGEPLEVGKCK